MSVSGGGRGNRAGAGGPVLAEQAATPVDRLRAARLAVSRASTVVAAA
jgi:hypothetical protein